MANIDRIVNATISLRTAGVRQESFSDMLILAEFTGDARLYTITAADQVVNDLGLTSAHPLYKAASVAFAQIPAPRQVFVGRRLAAEAPEVALAACAAESPGWYGIAIAPHIAADVLPAALWAEANGKLHGTALSDPKTVTAADDDTASALLDGNYFRTDAWYHPDPTEYPEIAIMARKFAILPGGETWANSRLSAVKAVKLTEGQYLFAKNKNVNTFEPTRNLAITQNGKVSAGEWIDVIRFRDWLCEEIRTSVLQAFIDNRIPYTDEGIGIIVQRARVALDLGVTRRGIAPPEYDPDNDRIVPSYVIDFPRSTQVSLNDKAARHLRDVTFSARLAGAIHTAEISGALTYDNIG